MKIRHFLWFHAVLFAVKALMFSAIKYAPGSEWLSCGIPIFYGIGSIVMYLGAKHAGRLPESHWINQPHPIQIGIMILLSLLAFVLILAG